MPASRSGASRAGARSHERRTICHCVYGLSRRTPGRCVHREARFIERVLAPLCERWPKGAAWFRDVTTREAVRFVRAARQRRCHGHAAAPAAQSQRALPGRYSPPLLTAARAQTEPDRQSCWKSWPRGIRASSWAPTVRRTPARQGKRLRLRRIFSPHASIELLREIFDARACCRAAPFARISRPISIDGRATKARSRS